jgi:hypothetical protein
MIAQSQAIDDNAATVALCRGPRCASATLIKAHIMPAGFARAMHREGGFNLSLSTVGAHRARHQHGKLDKTILCKDCDA